MPFSFIISIASPSRCILTCFMSASTSDRGLLAAADYLALRPQNGRLTYDARGAHPAYRTRQSPPPLLRPPPYSGRRPSGAEPINPSVPPRAAPSSLPARNVGKSGRWSSHFLPAWRPPAPPRRAAPAPAHLCPGGGGGGALHSRCPRLPPTAPRGKDTESLLSGTGGAREDENRA